MQVTHSPAALQTLLLPQEVPAALGRAVSVQLATPPVHASVPSWQALAGTQESPAAHGAQAPSLHTMPCPQLAPLGALPSSWHSGFPEAQSIAPTWQALPAMGHSSPR